MDLSFRQPLDRAQPSGHTLLRLVPASLALLALSTAPLLVWALAPRSAAAAERIKVTATSSDTPPTSGPLSAPALAGAIVRSATATTTWYLYPGACTDRASGTWTPRTTPQADSLNSYASGGPGPYTIEDHTQQEILWHVSDNATCVPGVSCPSALSGSRMLWCGKNDPSWVMKLGYPNFTYQILYIDTGAHGANFNLTLTYNFSSEFNYDYVWLVGGGGGAVDP